jgi:nicotinamidase-related amidase
VDTPRPDGRTAVRLPEEAAVLRIYGKDVPTTLEELVEPSSTALVIIDMQNDCCSKNGSADKAGGDLSMYRDVIPQIARFADACRMISVPVINVGIYTLPDGRSDSPAWIRMRMRAHKNYDPLNEGPWGFTLLGTWGAEFVDELRPQAGDLYVAKHRSSAFSNTNLDLLLRSNGIRSVMVAGCTTEGCVESTVRDLCFYDYFAVVLADCVGSDVRELHDASMKVMSAYRADIATSSEIIQTWGLGTGADRTCSEPSTP